MSLPSMHTTTNSCERVESDAFYNNLEGFLNRPSPSYVFLFFFKVVNNIGCSLKQMVKNSKALPKVSSKVKLKPRIESNQEGKASIDNQLLQEAFAYAASNKVYLVSLQA